MLVNDIASLLATKSVGTVGTDMFIGHMPDTPSNCIALMQNSGSAPELAGSIVGQIERPRLVIRVRNSTYLNGQNKARDVLKALHTEGEITLNGHRYLYIRAVGSVNQLGRDHELRSLFSLDFVVTKEMD